MILPFKSRVLFEANAILGVVSISPRGLHSRSWFGAGGKPEP